MTITSWRITHKKYISSAFTGEGAKQFGGRWNPPGYPAVYSTDSMSLAILELIVHLEDDQDVENYVVFPVEFNVDQVITLPEKDLSKNWASLPISTQTQQIGKKWLETGDSLVLKVPSSIVPKDSNFLINPLHPHFPSLQIGDPQPITIDQRLLT